MTSADTGREDIPTRNYFSDAIKTFLNWCCSREGGNPLSYIKKETRDSERKGVLTKEQFVTLIHSTIERNAIRDKANGRERGILYLLAINWVKAKRAS